MTIYFSASHNEPVALEVNPSDKLPDLKTKLAERGIEISSKYRYIANGKTLLATSTLAEQGVTAGTKIDAVTPLRN